jgi:hypothetical protein
MHNGLIWSYMNIIRRNRIPTGVISELNAVKERKSPVQLRDWGLVKYMAAA